MSAGMAMDSAVSQRKRVSPGGGWRLPLARRIPGADHRFSQFTEPLIPDFLMAVWNEYDRSHGPGDAHRRPGKKLPGER